MRNSSKQIVKKLRRVSQFLRLNFFQTVGVRHAARSATNWERRGWLIDTMTVDVVPYRWLKYAFLIPAAAVGGRIFSTTGSWLFAAQWDVFAYLVCWALVKPVEWIGELLVRGMLLFLPSE